MGGGEGERGRGEGGGRGGRGGGGRGKRVRRERSPGRHSGSEWQPAPQSGGAKRQNIRAVNSFESKKEGRSTLN